MISVGWRLRDGISAHNTRHGTAHVSAPFALPTTRHDNEHSCCWREASQSAWLADVRENEGTLLALMHLPYSPRPCRLASPSHARRAERCYFPRQHSTPLIWLAWPATAVRVCMPPPACSKHTRAHHKRTKTALSAPLDTPVISLGLHSKVL